MPGIFNPKQTLNPSEEQTATLSFEPAARNTIRVQQGQCPQCLRRIGEKGHRSSAVKVWTAQGIDYWCATCFEKGFEEKTCIKYRSLSKKERKLIRKALKKGKK